MQSYTFSFIGVGNMGGALARAAVKKLPPEQVFLSNRTFEKAEALAGELRPACVVAVDALASRSLDRLCRTVQLSDTGVIPGSGVGNHRRPLNRETLGVPVVTVGVPTVVDGATLALDLLERAGHRGTDRGDLPGGEEFFVTPREVDQRVADLGKTLGYGVSLALNPSLSLDDLVMLLE